MKTLTSKNVGKLAAVLKKNLADVQVEVVRQVAEQYKEQVQSKAPSESALPTYASGFQSIRINDGWLVTVEAERRVLTLTDAESVAVYLEPANKAAEQEPSLLLLQAFQPYTVGTLPIAPNPAVMRVVYRKVRADEFLGIQDRVVSNLSKITAALSRLGIPFQKVSTVDAYEDLAFKILRAELLGDPNVPRHWRPALSQISNFDVPEDISDLLAKGVKGLAKPVVISEDVRKQVRAFERKIL